MIQDIADALLQSWRNFASAFVLFVPRLVAATIIFTGGLVVSLIARRAVQLVLVWLRVDRLSLRTGASEPPWNDPYRLCSWKSSSRPSAATFT